MIDISAGVQIPVAEPELSPGGVYRTLQQEEIG
jgi:hypothetical protein